MLELGAAAKARVCAGDSALPVCRQGSLWIIAAITQGEVILKILRHLTIPMWCITIGCYFS